MTSERPSLDGDLSPALPAALLAAQAARRVPLDSARTDRDILRLSWPVVVAQLLVTVVQIGDILMLGRLGTPTLAAVGYASQFFFLVQAVLIAIGAAGVAMMARALGASEPDRARGAFATMLLLSLVASSGLSLVAVALPRELLHTLDVPAPIVELAVPYFRLTLGSSVLLAIALAFEHAHQAAKDTLRPMRIAAVVSVVKLALNALLVFGMFGLPRLELVGAGIATVVAQLVGLVLYVEGMFRRSDPSLRLRVEDLRQAPRGVAEAMRLALPAVGERVLMVVAIMAYFRFLGQYGVAAIAAYNVGVRILSFTWIPGLGLSVAASTLVGQALGAGDAALARQSGWRATWLGLALSTMLAVPFIALRVEIAAVFTDDPSVLRDLDSFILMLGLGLPFLVVHFTLAGALRGSGDTMTPLLAAAFGNWGFRVPLSFAFARVWSLSLPWLWSLMVMDHLARSIWLALAFRARRWDLQVGATVTRR